MRLRTYESFWLIKNGLLYSYPSLRKNADHEIAVIGGGITGALISHSLLQAGYDVVLLDKRDIGQGSTAATTSMLQYEIDVPLYKLAGQIGEDAAAYCYQAGIDAINELQNLIQKEKIDCGFEKKKSLYIAHNQKAAGWLKKEFEVRNQHRLGVTWLSNETVLRDYGLVCEGAILSETAASIDAYKFTQELIHKNTLRGLTVYDQTVIKKFDFESNGVEIHLESGYKVSCKKIIFCTGFETMGMFNDRFADLLSTFAVVSEQGIELPKKLNDILVWNTERPYLYMRSTDDGRLLVGGADSKHNSGVYRENLKTRKAHRLMKALKKIMPGISFVDDFTWAGVFGSTEDGLPFIGEHKSFPNAVFVLGFGGNGITFSVQGMQLVRDVLDGRYNRLLELYRFDRK